jgi:hypothetical protein
MGSGNKLTDEQLNAFLAGGHTQAQAARHFQVSESAVYQRLRRQGHRNARALSMEHGAIAVERQLDGAQRLARIQAAIDGELDWALAEARRAGADRASLVDVVLKLTGEVRAQLGLQLQISKALVDVKLIREFQEVVIDTIREQSPEVARAIVDRLRARRALRPSCELPGITGGSPDAAMG